MKKIFLVYLAVFFCFSLPIFAQIPVQTLVQISRAEDELRFDKTLEDLMKSPDAKIRARVALAAGRIGKDAALPFLVNLLEKDSDVKVRSTAAFAIGEMESIDGADALLRQLQKTGNADEVSARAIEAAGKIAAANAKDEKSKPLGKAILNALQREDNKVDPWANRNFVLLGITAILRARPEGGEAIAAKFLNSNEERIRADAANTLSRLRAKNASEKLRSMLVSDNDAIARANAARALGAAEDKDAFNVLLNAAISDKDSRVRVSAIRSLGSLKDAKAADKLLTRGENLLAEYKKAKTVNTLVIPYEENELLVIASTLGTLLKDSDNKAAVKFILEFAEWNEFQSSEISTAFASISPKIFLEQGARIRTVSVKYSSFGKPATTVDWKTVSAAVQGLGGLADNKSENIRLSAEKAVAQYFDGKLIFGKDFDESSILPAMPEVLSAYAKFKPENLLKVLRNNLKHKDVFIRATAAELLGDTTPSKENVEALKSAFGQAILLQELMPDKNYNDAQLAIITALAKQDKGKKEIEFLFPMALQAPDILVRRHTANTIKQYNLGKELPVIEAVTYVNEVLPLRRKKGTKLGMILNTNADYTRAVSRRSARAILTTEKGIFTIEFSPADAPLTVDNFIKLANAKYFDGLAIHRVVPNFVMQDGDPRGDGNGGPGWSIRCEVNMLPFERGAVGMALSGKDTGGSQWFVTHSPQPHLDGGYTVFGRVNETGMKIVDNLVRGDKILSVKIVEGNLPQRNISHEQTRKNTKIKKN